MDFLPLHSRKRVFNAREPFNCPISRVNLSLFTLIERKGKISVACVAWRFRLARFYYLARANQNRYATQAKISETFVMRSWTWV